MNTETNKLVFDFNKDPALIESESFKQIRAQSDLSQFSAEQAQIVMRMIHTCGDPGIAQYVRFSANAVSAGLESLQLNKHILCDVEMVKHGLTKRMLTKEPLCFLNEPDIPQLARQQQQTRTMSALSKWPDYMAASIILIGNAPTALFRLMEILDQGAAKPLLIIAMPVGFIGASESKAALLQHHQSLGIECITLHGNKGGSALTAGAMNTLIRLQQGIYC